MSQAHATQQEKRIISDISAHARDTRFLEGDQNKWKVVVVLFVLGLVITTGWVIFFPEQWKLFLLFLYTIPSNSLIPIPHEPGYLYFSRFLPVIPICIVGTLATCVAAANDYLLVSWVLDRDRIKAVKEHRIFHMAVEGFSRFPFLTIFFFALAPLPYYPIRVVAIGSGYSMTRYISAFSLGRLPRYYVLAVTGAYLNLPTEWILIILASIIAVWCYTARRHFFHRSNV